MGQQNRRCRRTNEQRSTHDIAPRRRHATGVHDTPLLQALKQQSKLEEAQEWNAKAHATAVDAAQPDLAVQALQQLQLIAGALESDQRAKWVDMLRAAGHQPLPLGALGIICT
jgi:hypothetical protein